MQRPSNLPVSIKGIYSWNLNSWSPGLPTNIHKTWVVRTMLKKAPVLLQETKWNQANFQFLMHSWPEIKVVTTLAEQNAGEQAGVAILFPRGWKVKEEKVLVKHYAIAACVEYQACTIWLVSVYIPPTAQSPLSPPHYKPFLRWTITLFLLEGTSIEVISITSKRGMTF